MSTNYFDTILANDEIVEDILIKKQLSKKITRRDGIFIEIDDSDDQIIKKIEKLSSLNDDQKSKIKSITQCLIENLKIESLDSKIIYFSQNNRILTHIKVFGSNVLKTFHIIDIDLPKKAELIHDVEEKTNIEKDEKEIVFETIDVKNVFFFIALLFLLMVSLTGF